MEYNDEALLSPEGYADMAMAYASAIKKEGFVFVSLDTGEQEKFLNETLQLFYLLKDNLFALGGFLGTGALYNLNNKQLLELQKLFDRKFEYAHQRFNYDKTKLFLNMLSLENTLINKLLDLAFHSDKTKEIVDIIKERTSLSSSLYHINGVISSFHQ